MSLKLEIEKCKGCGYCIHFCPKEVLSLSSSFNMEGYPYIQADESKCIGCGICYTMCPDNVISIVEP